MASEDQHLGSKGHNCIGFSLSNVTNGFNECYDGNSVVLKKYVDAYRELVRFLNTLGTLFSFITSDVDSKVEILQQHVSSVDAENYATIEKMTSHEIGLGLPTTWANKQLPSGSRTLLRLHRAMSFLSLLFSDLASSKPEGDASFSTIVSNAYNSTLARYHSWLIRKTVFVALYALPSRRAILERMKSEGTEDQIAQKLKDTVAAMMPVYDHVQQLYESNGLLDLR